MRQLDVAIDVLQHIRARALQNACEPRRKPSGMTAGAERFPTCFDSDKTDGAVWDERIKNTEGVAAAADTRYDGIRQGSGDFLKLPARFAADHRLKFTNHQRIRVRS